MIKICKILKQIYNSGNYYVFSAWCGEPLTIIYSGDKPPKPLKTVDYQVTGEVKNNQKHGKGLIITEYKKIGKIKIHKPNDDYRYQ
jgi:hypothetical protein